jgi:trehalose 6-phosphate phosphatase
MVEDLLEHPEAIEAVLACRPCGLVTDIDGTIAQIASRPAEAHVSPSCREGLVALVGRLDLVAVVSGRPAREARDMVGVEGLVYVGNHGLERLQDGRVVVHPAALPYQEPMRAAMAELQSRLSAQQALAGFFVEDKGVSFSLHYRACPDPAQARALILEAAVSVARARGLQVMEARRAVELRPPLAADKGTALRGLQEQWGLRGIFYLGDDYTDVRAFQALRDWRDGVERRGLAVAVVSPGAPQEALAQADFTLAGISGAEGFLKMLRQLLSEPGPGGPPTGGRAT